MPKKKYLEKYTEKVVAKVLHHQNRRCGETYNPILDFIKILHNNKDVSKTLKGMWCLLS